MAYNGIYTSTRVSTSKNQAHLSDRTMDNISGILLKPCCMDRQGGYIAVLNELLCGLTRLCVVELTIGVYTFIFVLQQSVAKDIIRVIVLMHPYEWNNIIVLILERISHNGSPIGAAKIGTCSPSAKVV